MYTNGHRVDTTRNFTPGLIGRGAGACNVGGGARLGRKAESLMLKLLAGRGTSIVGGGIEETPSVMPLSMRLRRQSL